MRLNIEVPIEENICVHQIGYLLEICPVQLCHCRVAGSDHFYHASGHCPTSTTGAGQSRLSQQRNTRWVHCARATGQLPNTGAGVAQWRLRGCAIPGGQVAQYRG
jgi:hypothetical protein